MEWKQLWSSARRYDNLFEDRKTTPLGGFLSHHSRDPDRVLFSSAFRRLQGKTQVYIFPNTDFVRNRLTHSLEVASLGRNLASGIFKRLSNESSAFRALSGSIITEGDFSDCVAAACLAHDLGNPPFGHVGEYAIQSWFKASRDVNNLKEAHRSMRGKYSDFHHFDGNAQAFRVVNRLQGWGHNEGGLRLTATTLAAMVKYPNSSDSTSRYSSKLKFGYYKDDEKIFDALADHLGLSAHSASGHFRHPLAFITEAADDIAYLTSDIEDARKFGMIEYGEAFYILERIASRSRGFDKRVLDSIKSQKGKLKFLRSAAAVSMVEHCVGSFLSNEDVLLEGEMHYSLLTKSLPDLEAEIRRMNEEKIYFQYRKVKAETGAYEVVRAIMDTFSQAIMEHLSKCPTERSSNLMKLMVPVTRHLSGSDNAYKNYLALVDFVSGMTDRYAVDIFETISGRKLVLGF